MLWGVSGPQPRAGGTPEHIIDGGDGGDGSRGSLSAIESGMPMGLFRVCRGTDSASASITVAKRPCTPGEWDDGQYARGHVTHVQRICAQRRALLCIAAATSSSPLHLPLARPLPSNSRQQYSRRRLFALSAPLHLRPVSPSLFLGTRALARWQPCRPH